MHVCLGKEVVIRNCAHAGSVGCDYHYDEDYFLTAITCICNTDMCNRAVMTSSFGHVITAVALLISVVIGYMM